MKQIILHIIFHAVVFVLLTGCSANKTSGGYCHEKGILSAHIYDSANNGCKVEFRYNNRSKYVQKPLIHIIAYDKLGTVVTQEKIYFKDLKPGASQNLSKVLECNNKQITKIYIYDAVDSNRCYGYDCSALCESKGTTLDLSK